ncbi:MAG: MlaD family protein [Paludibacteraceae bacterium]|nr:MlaD family protein [Paludibacteraceae bacterium]
MSIVKDIMNFKLSKEFKIGLWVIVTIAVTFFGVNYLKGINIFNPTNYYYLTFDHINGLVETNVVNIKGYKVGLVKKIIYDYDHPNSDVVVVLQVDDDLKIPVGTRAGLVSGLLGSPTIELFIDPMASSTEFYKRGDTIPSYIDNGVMEALSTELMPRIQSIIPQLDSLMVSLQVIAQNKAIEKSLSNIETITTNLKGTSVSLNKLVDNDVPQLIGNANSMMTKFDKVGDNLSVIDFNKTVNELNQTLSSVHSVADKINKGNGTLGLLLNDNELYNKIGATVGSANDLLIDLKANPKRYVHFSLTGKNKEK